MRAPPESLMPMQGQPVLCARSMILVTFSANTSPSEPPNTDASWLKTNTWRPSMVPHPVTTPSPRMRRSSMPKLFVRCIANLSGPGKEPASSSRSMRSRAVSFPLLCCERSAAPPRWIASYRRLRRTLILRSVMLPSFAGVSFLRLALAMTEPYPPSDRDGRAVDAEHGTECATDFADRRARGEGIAQKRQKIRVSFCAAAEGGECPVHLTLRTFGAEPAQPAHLFIFEFRADPQGLYLRLRRFGETVDTDDAPSPGLLQLLVPICGILDLALVEPGFDRGHRAAKLVDASHQRVALLDEPVGERFDEG